MKGTRPDLIKGRWILCRARLKSDFQRGLAYVALIGKLLVSEPTARTDLIRDREKGMSRETEQGA